MNEALIIGGRLHGQTVDSNTVGSKIVAGDITYVMHTIVMMSADGVREWRYYLPETKA